MVAGRVYPESTVGKKNGARSCPLFTPLLLNFGAISNYILSGYSVLWRGSPGRDSLVELSILTTLTPGRMIKKQEIDGNESSQSK